MYIAKAVPGHDVNSDRHKLIPGWFKSALQFCAGVIGLAAGLAAYINEPESTSDERVILLALIASSLVLAAGSAWLLYCGGLAVVLAVGALRRHIENTQRTTLFGAFRALVFALFGLAALVVNSLLLNEFFRSLTAESIYLVGVQIPMSVFMGSAYSAILLMLGVLLSKSPDRSVYGSIWRLAILSLTGCYVATEVLIYGLLSVQISWPWPAPVPTWADAWLAIIGLLIGGGLSIAGFMFGKNWDSTFGKPNTNLGEKVSAQ